MDPFAVMAAGNVGVRAAVAAVAAAFDPAHTHVALSVGDTIVTGDRRGQGKERRALFAGGPAAPGRIGEWGVTLLAAGARGFLL